MSLFHWCRYLVNALVQETQPGKPEDAVCRNSCLTHLLRESLGGNAKLTVICNVSPDNKYVILTFCYIQKYDVLCGDYNRWFIFVGVRMLIVFGFKPAHCIV